LPPANPQWFIDGTLIPVRDQSITAISKNYRRSVNAQIIICAHRRRVIVAGQCQPANRNDVIVARRTLVQLLDGRVVLGDGGYRAITSIATPRRDHCGRIIRDDHYRVHRRIKARAKHVITRLKDRSANTAAMPPPRRRHQSQPPHHRRTLTLKPESNHGSPPRHQRRHQVSRHRLRRNCVPAGLHSNFRCESAVSARHRAELEHVSVFRRS